jgi:hypothetical protein
MWHIVAAQRYNYTDPGLANLVDMAHQVSQSAFSKPNITIFLPFLKKIMPSMDADPIVVEAISEIKKFLHTTIKEHIDTYNPENIRDFIDSFIREIKVCTLVYYLSSSILNFYVLQLRV